MSATETRARVAAFFDLDGTLLPLPSLERRFVSMLKGQSAIPATNYLCWLTYAIRLAPLGITAVTHANKTYLRTVSATETLKQFPAFFPAALDRVARHASQGHSIILVTGTPELLAKQAALALTLRLLVRGITASVGVRATRLEEVEGRWTGRITGEAMFGAAKASAIQRIAASNGFDLARSYAYGDATHDRWMLGAVGRPTAVNPSRELQRIAHLRNWPILLWKENHPQHANAITSTEASGGCTAIRIMKSESLG
jgi:HAD superfamily hydrolase (TIGR01490 family)